MPIALGASILLCSSLLFAQSPAQTMTRAEQEHFLLTARITNIRAGKGGITGTRRATLVNGAITHDAHIQTIDESKVRFEGANGTEMNFRDTYKFNIAAYRLDKLLDLQMIPPSVERNVEGMTGAVTWWVDDVLMEETQRAKKGIEPPDGDRWNNQMYIVRVFDQLIFNTDRNLGNLLITKDWKLWMIDHTRAFRTRTTLLAPKNLTRCDRDLLAAMMRLNEKELHQELDPFLRRAEITALLKRRDQIVALFEKAPPAAIYSSQRRR
ncbi:MAG TPA: hypothetical protein VGK29_07930 [Paludibaculum sp.]|jgi:hypothetical protein